MEYTTYIDLETLDNSDDFSIAERPVRRNKVRRTWSEEVLIAEDFSEFERVPAAYRL